MPASPCTFMPLLLLRQLHLLAARALIRGCAVTQIVGSGNNGIESSILEGAGVWAELNQAGPR